MTMHILPLNALDHNPAQTLPDVVEQLDLAVVQIRNESKGMGSGVNIADDGLALSNIHVAQGLSRVRLGLTDRREAEADVICDDPDTDIALLRAASLLQRLAIVPH